MKNIKKIQNIITILITIMILLITIIPSPIYATEFNKDAKDAFEEKETELKNEVIKELNQEIDIEKLDEFMNEGIRADSNELLRSKTGSNST